jgi:SAM-dependent methyltransferase
MADGAFEYSVEFYDALYGAKDYAGEASAVSGMIREQLPSANELLDIGSGTGRHALEFERLGFSVTGVDVSPEMVEAAKRRSSQVDSRCKFLVGDARDLRLGHNFDAVVSLFHVASYQSTDRDLRNYFSTVAAHLKTGGIFVFDFWCAAGVLSEPPQARVRRVKIPQGEVIRITEPTHHVADSIVDVRFEYQLHGAGSGLLSRSNELHKMRYFSVSELRALLAGNGLSILHAGEFASGPLSPRTFNGLIVARNDLEHARV